MFFDLRVQISNIMIFYILLFENLSSYSSKSLMIQSLNKIKNLRLFGFSDLI